MTEQLQPQIRALLNEAENRGEVVTNLARSCLAHFRKECQAILAAHEVNLMGSILEVGSEARLPELARERDDLLDEAGTASRRAWSGCCRQPKERGGREHVPLV